VGAAHLDVGAPTSVGGPVAGPSGPGSLTRSLPLPAGPADAPEPVTAIVVARNEEARIEGCLRSLLWADRILVIDNDSSDRTGEIARGYTEWVVPHRVDPKVDPVHGNLNFAFTLVPSGWILQIDADERASTALAREVRERCTGAHEDGYWVPFRFAMLGRWIRYGYWGHGARQIRLFRAGRAIYPLRSLHENADIRGTVGRLRESIYHLPYPTVAEFVAKTNRYTTREVDLVLAGGSPGISGLGRKAAHPSGFRILWSGVRLFLWSFIRLGGWREGRTGIATSAMLGMYGLLEVLKVWEKADGLEGEIELPEDRHV
jgi:glycosyltransferase involved in cell wall biosynthesis